MSTLIQNFYKTTITRNWSATTGDFNVSVKPTISAGWLVISANNSTLREIVKYSATGTNAYGDFVTISNIADRGIGGTTAQTHTIGESVRINITAEHWAELNANAVAPTVAVGTVISGASPAVSNSGTSVNAVFDFILEKGEQGEPGANGTGATVVTTIATPGLDTIVPSEKAVRTILDLKSPLASPTFTGLVTTPLIKITGGTPGLSKVLTSDADGDATWETPVAGGSTLWTTMPGTPTRTSNTTFTVTGDITSYVAKGMIIKWTESSTVRVAMVSIPSTYGAPNTTITIIGDTMASIDASSLKYCMLGAEMFQKNFAVAGTLGATGTDIANAYYATEPMRVIGMDLQHGTAGVTTTFVMDCNKNGTTMFTTKPSLATTVASSPLPFTADTATPLAIGDRVSIDIDTINTGTLAIDLYAQLYLLPTRYINLT
jgi:hypothetical protein